MSKRFAIGIDGGKKTGFAVWDRSMHEFMKLESCDFWTAYKYVVDHFTPKNAELFIEDPSQNKPVFMKKGVRNNKAFSKVAQNVGGVKRETNLLIEGIELEGFDVKRIVPRKGIMTKIKAEPFRNITGYEGRTNEHSRDAAMMVFQR